MLLLFTYFLKILRVVAISSYVKAVAGDREFPDLADMFAGPISLNFVGFPEFRTPYKRIPNVKVALGSSPRQVEFFWV
jgi:hypothetical protein